MPRSLNLHKNKHINYKSKRKAGNSLMIGGTIDDKESKTKKFILKDCISESFSSALSQMNGMYYVKLLDKIDRYNNIDRKNNVTHILGVILRAKLDFEINCIKNYKDTNKSRINYELSPIEVRSILRLRVPENIYIDDIFMNINKPLDSDKTINMVEMIVMIYQMYVYANNANATRPTDDDANANRPTNDDGDGVDGDGNGDDDDDVDGDDVEMMWDLDPGGSGDANQCNLQKLKGDNCCWTDDPSINTSSIWTNSPKLVTKVEVEN